MSIVLSAMLLLALSVSPALPEKAAEKTSSKAVAGPRLEISPDLYDFGRAKQNQRG